MPLAVGRFLGREEAGDAAARFFRVPADANDEAILADLERLLPRDGGETRYGYVLREPLPPESSLAELDLKERGPAGAGPRDAPMSVRYGLTPTIVEPISPAPSR